MARVKPATRVCGACNETFLSGYNPGMVCAPCERALFAARESMIECGRRKLTRRDHVNALAAALRVPPAEIAPSTIAGSDEWAPAPAPACAFPPAGDDITMARHRDLAGRFTGHVISGDTCAAGAWLRRLARGPYVSPWLLLDQLTTAQHAVPGLSLRLCRGN